MEFLFDAIRQHAAEHGDRPALVDDQGTHIPYAALPFIADSVALHALDAGLGAGQMAAIATPAHSNIGLLVSLGLLRAGIGIAVATEDQLDSAGVVPDAVLRLQAAAQPGGKKVIAVGADWMTHPEVEASAKRLSETPDPSPIAVLFSSSGSTGQGKLIPMGAEAVRVKVAEKEIPGHGAKGQLNLFSPMSPMGLSIDYSALFHGKTIFRFGKETHKYKQVFSERGIHSLYASPYDIGKLVDFAERYELNATDHIKYVFTGGSMLSRETLERAQGRLSKRIYFSYGTTEVSRITISELNDIPQVPGAVGRVEDRARVEIVDERGQVVGLRQEGRVRISVPPEHRALGYILSDNTITPFPDRYFFPGDLGMLIEGNNLVIHGRESDVASYGGNKVALEDIESLLLKYPAVEDAVAVSRENQHGFDDIFVAVVPKEGSGLSAETISQYLHTSARQWKARSVIVVDAVPRNDMGKIDRQRAKRTVFGFQNGETA